MKNPNKKCGCGHDKRFHAGGIGSCAFSSHPEAVDGRGTLMPPYDCHCPYFKSAKTFNSEPLKTAPEARPIPELYYIQNIRMPVGNSALWWRVDGGGYTCNLDEAWKVDAEKAASICRDRPKEDIPRLASAMDALAQRHVDVQGLPRDK